MAEVISGMAMTLTLSQIEPRGPHIVSSRPSWVLWGVAGDVEALWEPADTY